MDKQEVKKYWRSLNELADAPEFQKYLRGEFLHPADTYTDALTRRNFLKLMGASLAMAGLSACTRQPTEEIFPYVRAPEEIVPGKPLCYATAMTLGGFAAGVLVESHMGRPTKIEGNPQHPASLGATDVFAQASVLGLYDPDRSKVVTNLGSISTWTSFLGALNLELERLRASKGAGLRILTETVTSPTLAHQLESLLTAFPGAKWRQYEPVCRDNLKAGARLAFGEQVETHYCFSEAKVIISLDADFLFGAPGSVRYAREFAAKRRISDEAIELNRLYVFEPTPTLTGSMADHRWPVSSSQIIETARVIARELGVIEDGGLRIEDSKTLSAETLKAIARDLERNRGASIVLAGDAQPPIVHALVHAINSALGNVGKTVVYTEPVEARPVEQIASLRELVTDMEAGAVDVLIIVGGNPVYTAPADVPFLDGLFKVKFRAHLGLYEDETSELCHWHIPEAHYLESWSDARAYDGTVTILQPLIAPLYGGKSAHELMAALLGRPERTGYEVVREYWKSQFESRRVGGQDTPPDFEKFWRSAVHDGLIASTTLPTKQVALNMSVVSGQLSAATDHGRRTTDSEQVSLEIVFRPDPTVWDGRFANNGWLQELPKPLMKLTWDNAALISPATAERLSLNNGDVVQVSDDKATVLAPIWIMPGQANDVVTVHLGYGRRRSGRIGSGVGFDAYALRTTDKLWFGSGVQLAKTSRHYPLVSTQEHHSMEGRHLVRVGAIEEYRSNPNFAREMSEEPPPEMSLYPPFKYEGASWGMAIDLNACIGCNACVVACQSENNIPVVGKREVGIGREMQWIRIDRYFEGDDLANPGIYHQPVMCMHCDSAPCEVVCPTGATNHSREGLNQMVYNRCVGTRYCSNNCPYKVRRFNFRLYADWNTTSLKMQRNPDVTVRSRGVMEKCTYCVQRINAARIEAEKEDRTIRDGEVVTACQAACPTEAIVFGDMNDPQSRVAKLKAQSLNYGILTELNTQPRTTYLARVTNPNPEIVRMENRK